MKGSSAIGSAWLPALVPVVAVVAVLSLSLGSHLSTDNGNLTAFVQFGSAYARYTHPPQGAVVLSGQGYDGQFFYVQARDPLLLRDSTVTDLRKSGAGFRMQRMAYPALAFLLAAGQDGAIPLSLLVINVLVTLGVTAGFAVFCRRRGWSNVWAVAVGLMPGMLLTTLGDLSDALATASVLAGLLLWQSRRRAGAAVFLTVAALTREAMIVAVLAVAIEAGLRAWSARHQPGSVGKIVSETWPVVVIPAAAFLAWQVYIGLRYGAQVGGPNADVPVYNLIQEIRWSFQYGSAAYGTWDLIYVLLIAAAVVGAFASLRRRVTPLTVAASLVALTVLVPELGDVVSDTRVSLPLFVLLLVVGLEQGDRRLSGVSAAAAAMTALMAVAIPGVF